MMIIKQIQRFLFVLICLLSSLIAKAQQIDTLNFSNISLLNGVFEKLHKLETSKHGKINIVHIGDSHIQAGFFTSDIREQLQARFGNGGYGFTFPYSLAKTNSPKQIRYSSNEQWQSLRNIYPISDVPIGLSGIGLYNKSNKFGIALSASDEYKFDTIKIISPNKEPIFALTQPQSDTITLFPSHTRITRKVYHRVRSKETLHKISQKYNITIAQLKRANHLKSNKIAVGRRLLIPNQTIKNEHEKIIPVPKGTPLEMKFSGDIATFSSPKPINNIFIVPQNTLPTYNLNGIVLENSKPGLIYHSIGVNGAKASDYNKYPLFFNQLTALSPDLFVISLGTNESFGKIDASEYIREIDQFVDNIRKTNKNTPILLMTPPPSFFRKRIPNTFLAAYCQKLEKLKGCVVWNLYSKMGGSKASSRSLLMAKDKIHYTVDGYAKQGLLFTSDFLKAYNAYTNKTN